MMSAQEYYRLFNAEAEKNYSPRRFRELAREHGHYGPFHESEEVW